MVKDIGCHQIQKPTGWRLNIVGTKNPYLIKRWLSTTFEITFCQRVKNYIVGIFFPFLETVFCNVLLNRFSKVYWAWLQFFSPCQLFWQDIKDQCVRPPPPHDTMGVRGKAVPKLYNLAHFRELIFSLSAAFRQPFGWKEDFLSDWSQTEFFFRPCSNEAINLSFKWPPLE